MPRASGTNLQADLDNLAKSKELLASAIDIVRYLERIQRSLESIAVMGADAEQFSADAKRFFMNLGSKITELPAEKLRAYLARVDDLIRADLDRIVTIADSAARPDLLEDASLLFGLDEKAVKKLINEFERRTRTSVSMRVLMIRRGLEVDVLVIPIAEDLLQERIEHLDEKERECTGEIGKEISSMQEDIELILEHHDCGDSLRAQLEAVRDGLRDNLEHLRAGGSIDALPFPVEVAEGTDIGSWATAPAPDPEPEPLPPPAAPETSAEAAAESTQPAAPGEITPHGFFRTLWVYLTTPNHVTWKRARTWRQGQ